MNKKMLHALFSDLSPTHFEVSGAYYSQITTNLQKARRGDIVFYRIQKNDSAYKTFIERLGDNTQSLIVVNCICEKLIERGNCICIPFDKFYEAQKRLADEFYPRDNSMKIAGITGTNGKTTTVNVAMQIAEILGKRSIAVGTIGITTASGEAIEDLGATTPSYVELRRILHRYSGKVDGVFLEVSSHALDQKRLGNIELSAAAWTSFSQDHLDYHKTMEAYFAAKSEMVKTSMMEGAHCFVPSSEEELVDKLKNYHTVKVATSIDNTDLPLFFHPAYNKSNLELALELNRELWGGQINIDLSKISTPRGRFSVIEFEDNLAVVDYAHTPDALSNVCSAIKESFPEHTLVVVFGCGGDRDSSKRSQMGSAVAQFADRIFVTSDNPRSENPDAIIDQIVEGIDTSFERYSDRKVAILAALDSCDSKSLVLVAGKGHEEYQEISGIKNPFSDFEVIEEWKRLRLHV
jgi:UDP-N-acetylmuramoyl-L-alanyl-D-glutamate--2,6-diaminopimelate ligase